MKIFQELDRLKTELRKHFGKRLTDNPIGVLVEEDHVNLILPFVQNDPARRTMTTVSIPEDAYEDSTVDYVLNQIKQADKAFNNNH
jgi:hypothetical protein